MVSDPPPGHDPQGVEPLVILVEVAEGQRGLAFSEEHLGPLGLLQQHVCKTGKETGLRDMQGPGAPWKKSYGKTRQCIKNQTLHCQKRSI